MIAKYNWGLELTLNKQVKSFLRRVLVVGILSTLAAVSIAYAIDYGTFRYRVAADRNPFGQVTVQSYDAVQQKNGRTQFIFNPPEIQTCVHALFPHFGFVPCWYLRQHSEPRTDI